MVRAGGEVFVIGHAAWNSRHGLSATVTAGVISKLVTHHAVPVLIQVVSLQVLPPCQVWRLPVDKRWK